LPPDFSALRQKNSRLWGNTLTIRREDVGFVMGQQPEDLQLELEEPSAHCEEILLLLLKNFVFLGSKNKNDCQKV
jgi:hypothetical protein